jgi:hypothetical protein
VIAVAKTLNLQTSAVLALNQKADNNTNRKRATARLLFYDLKTLSLFSLKY